MTDTQANTNTEEKKDVVPSHYRDKYKETGGTCGDFIATNLQKIAKDGVDSLNTVKAENDIEADRWAGFNPGMQRMNLANVLRGKFLNGSSITILGKQYNAVHQSEDANFTIENTPESMGKMADFLELQNNSRTVAALTKLFFPPVKKASGKTDEQRAEEKAAKDAAKQANKDYKAALREADKASKAVVKANEKLEKITAQLDEANKAAADLGQAVKDAADDAAKKAASAKLTKAVDKVGDLEDKVDEAAKAADAATKLAEELVAKADSLAPAEAE